MLHKTLIVLPSFNVGEVIGDVISLLPKDNTLIVDDGSQDNTFEVVEKLGYFVIQHSSNLGLSAAIRTGELYAFNHGYTHILLIDADGQHPTAFFNIFLSTLQTTDFVLGDRFSKLHNIPPQKIASNLFASLLVKEVTGIFIRDVSCGYRGYRLVNREFNTISNGYSEIYTKIIESALAGVIPKRVFIPAIYDFEQPIATKYLEIVALFLALSRFSLNSPLLLYISELVNNKANIEVKVCDVPFYANYVESLDSYIFSTDLLMAKKLYEN